MQQRRPRLGDIVDDYCPRERRITNHAVVAMIDDEVKQTRCVTCDADHEYKQARIPPQRKKKDSGSALYGAVLAGMPRKRAADEAGEPELPVLDAEDESVPGEPAEDYAAPAEELPAETMEAESLDADAEEPNAGTGDDEGPVHRRLIRATLPRPEGQVPERKLPDFTVRQRGFEANGNTNGQRPGGGRGPRRGPRPGQVRTQGGGGGGGQRFGNQRQGQPPRHGSNEGQRQNSGRPGAGQPGQRGPRRGGRKRGR